MLDAALTARSAAAAGMVLLKNVQNALPLTAEDGEALPVAVFGSGQIFTPCCEAAMDPWRKVSVLDGLCASDAVKPDGLLSHKYRTWALEHPVGGEYPLGSLSMEELAGCNRAAIVVIARTPEQTDCTLTDGETQMLRSVTPAFDRTILVLATPGFVELNDAAMACQAIVWMGIAGQEAGSALADVLTAKALPMGRLPFSWPVSRTDFDASNAQADQFVGYRYFDSFGAELRWPFGYGLGYGTCALGSVSVGLDGTDVTVSAEVENIGETWPAAEAVQVYISGPTPPVRSRSGCSTASPGQSCSPPASVRPSSFASRSRSLPPTARAPVPLRWKRDITTSASASIPVGHMSPVRSVRCSARWCRPSRRSAWMPRKAAACVTAKPRSPIPARPRN